MAATTTTTTRTAEQRVTDADMAAVRLAHTLPAADVAAVMAATERGVARSLGGSVHADEARADALARALRGLTNGLDVEHAAAAAVRDAVRDAAQRAAADALLSLDMPTGDGTATLADALDNGSASTARLSHHDDSQGGYKGVGRVPVPLDVLRPMIPSPHDCQEGARRALTTDACAVLDATLAVNVAAEQERAERVVWLTSLCRAKPSTRVESRTDDVTGARSARTVTTWPSWLAVDARHNPRAAAVLKTARTALDNAKREARADHNPHRPRTSEVAAVLGRPTGGRAAVALGQEQAQADASYWVHREAIVAGALAADMAAWDAIAERGQAAHVAASVDAYATVRTARRTARAVAAGRLTVAARPLCLAPLDTARQAARPLATTPAPAQTWRSGIALSRATLDALDAQAAYRADTARVLTALGIPARQAARAAHGLSHQGA